MEHYAKHQNIDHCHITCTDLSEIHNTFLGPRLHTIYIALRIITWHKQGDQTEEPTKSNISTGKMEQRMDVREKCDLPGSGSQLALILGFIVNSVHSSIFVREFAYQSADIQHTQKESKYI
jgi:hypothetical protein